MAKKSRKRPVPPHGKMAMASIAAVVTTLVLGVTGTSLRHPASVTGATPQDIALEHAAPATLTVVITEHREPGLVELWHDAPGDNFLTVPDAWTLREVKGGSLADVPAEESSGGFKRWRLPAGLRLSFLTPSTKNITLHNSSRAMMQVKWKMVDTEKGTVREETMLLKSKPVVLR